MSLRRRNKERQVDEIRAEGTSLKVGKRQRRSGCGTNASMYKEEEQDGADEVGKAEGRCTGGQSVVEVAVGASVVPSANVGYLRREEQGRQDEIRAKGRYTGVGESDEKWLWGTSVVPSANVGLKKRRKEGTDEEGAEGAALVGINDAKVECLYKS
jgi:hypothetical protein